MGKESDIAKDALKNAVMSLLHIGEHTFLKICKYPCSFTYIVVEHGEQKKRCLISGFLCGNLQNNFGPHKAPCHT